MSDITPLRPGKAFLPVGFQTKSATTIRSVVSKIDHQVNRLMAGGSEPVRVATDAILQLLKLIETTLDEADVDPFDWRAMKAAIEYYSRIAAPETDRGFCWLLSETDRDLARIRPGGRFSNAPHTEQQEDIVTRLGDRLPIVMLFRQNGDAAKGWRDAPFWWPVLFAPARSVPTVFAASLQDGEVGR